MYSPYLYGRGSELLALRSLISEKTDLTGLIPIIEPVLADTGAIHRCMDAFGKDKKALVILTNPTQHEYSNNALTQNNLITSIQSLFDSHTTLIPAYCIDSTTTQNDVKNFLSHYNKKEVALLYNNPTLSEVEIKTNAALNQILFHVILNDKISTAQLAEIPKNKIIDTRDFFNKLDRNADYSGRELFTDKHKNVGNNIYAIGDYTITGRKLEIGGGKPGAVASHITFKNSNTSDIWIEHFVSDDTDRNVSDAETKFLQMAKKLTKQVKVLPNEFGWNSSLQAYDDHVKQSTWSGLGKNKEYQIKHHIQLMLDVLNNRL
ncbi:MULTISPECIES: sce7725 family protein [Gammaproteobacteria]|uniref:sce7725 family protein n=1 Tax=Gammaproteobacteria TaxID=1236 RepID=UPI001913A36D|nr:MULTISPECIES: sce7725 family protein [Gammaproteobacteria]MBK5300096.1 sce7725 family protein [Bacillus sp. TH86]MBK5319865.1 sce7725 family protein [Bacillus sp. TH59]MBK5334815.1 sce7725 family protein [Bacillus sp. TH57]MBK5308904.1 sce7725 family protein [Pseudomonas sp. TH71]MBK5314364.1 sce7725 family protein [Erwinia sp. TH79]